MKTISISMMDKIFRYILKHLVTGKFTGKAEYIGTFVLIYLGLGGGFIAFMLFLGINPTLILSIVGAPVWVGIVFLSNRLTKIAIALKDIDDYKPKSKPKKEI
jgi:hypothetical protein|tara:strand:- start:48 stop:356 length:309 start_codon:yes stop_codon:yes gene_type:complete